MKKLILIFFLSCSILYFGQIENFKLENEQISWQKIYDTDKSFDEIYDLIKSNTQFSDVVRDENSITFLIKDYSIDYKGAGGSLLMTNAYISNSKYSGNVLLNFKDSKYRITLSHIMYLYTSMDLNFGRNQTSYSLEESVIKKSEFRSIYKKDSSIFNYSFTKLFDFSKYKKSTNDW